MAVLFCIIFDQEYLDGGKYEDVEGLEEKLASYKSKCKQCGIGSEIQGLGGRSAELKGCCN